MNFMMIVKGERGNYSPSPLYPFHDCVECPKCVVRHPRRHSKLSTSYRCHVELGERGASIAFVTHAARLELPEIPRNEVTSTG